MKRKQFVVFAVAVIAVLGALGAWWYTTRTLGPVPAIELTLIDGQKLALSSLRGRPVLVTFWSTSCRSCIKEIPQLNTLHNTFASQGLEIIAVAMPHDSPQAVMNAPQDLGLQYRIAMDLPGEAVRAFGNVRVTPTSFLIDPQGRIVKRQIGRLDHEATTEQIHRWLATRSG